MSTGPHNYSIFPSFCFALTLIASANYDSKIIIMPSFSADHYSIYVISLTYISYLYLLPIPLT